jgi:hypothetical protein
MSKLWDPARARVERRNAEQRARELRYALRWEEHTYPDGARGQAVADRYFVALLPPAWLADGRRMAVAVEDVGVLVDLGGQTYAIALWKVGDPPGAPGELVARVLVTAPFDEVRRTAAARFVAWQAIPGDLRDELAAPPSLGADWLEHAPGLREARRVTLARPGSQP